ncbi:MAG: hypothetical protein WDN26_23105 [Chitinophagaceae bacterium]
MLTICFRGCGMESNTDFSKMLNREQKDERSVATEVDSSNAVGVDNKNFKK